ECGAPAVIVEGAGEVVHVGGTVAFGTVVRVVEVQLVLVAPEAPVLGAIGGQVVIDAGNNGLTVATLDQGRRHRPRRRIEVRMAAGVRPNRIWPQKWRAAVVGKKFWPGAICDKEKT